MRARIRRYLTTAFRVFLAYCAVYVLFAVLFDNRSVPDEGISETRCTPKTVHAASEEELRRALIEAFAPTLVFSFREPANLHKEIAVPYQLVPDPVQTGRYFWRGAVIFPTDYGATALGLRASVAGHAHSLMLSRTVLRMLGWVVGQARMDAHIGDVEIFEFALRATADEGSWEIESLVTFPHGKLRIHSASEVQCFRDSPILYVSRGKHALYPTPQECHSSSVVHLKAVQVTAEECSIGSLFYPSTAPEFDVGDSAHPNNVFETSPTLQERGIFKGEDAWGACFYGGFGSHNTQRACRSYFRWR